MPKRFEPDDCDSMRPLGAPATGTTLTAFATCVCVGTSAIDSVCAGSPPRSPRVWPLPTWIGTRLRKSGELMFVYYVYHPAADAGGKPNLEADYTFYSNNAGVEKLFFKSSPQMFTADTVPADFDPALHQIMGGQSVPLATFSNGEYRLEVAVTDKISNTTTTTNTTFSVFGQ